MHVSDTDFPLADDELAFAFMREAHIVMADCNLCSPLCYRNSISNMYLYLSLSHSFHVYYCAVRSSECYIHTTLCKLSTAKQINFCKEPSVRLSSRSLI